MTDTITESFCERCGTRFSFEAKKRRRPVGIGRARVLGRGLKNYLVNDGLAMAEAMAEARDDQERARVVGQLDQFHKTFNFCMTCRQYTCASCWNAQAAECLSCAPLPGPEAGQAPILDLAGTAPATGSLVAEGSMDGPMDGLIAPVESAWPQVDLDRPAAAGMTDMAAPAAEPSPGEQRGGATPPVAGMPPPVVGAAAEPEPILEPLGDLTGADADAITPPVEPVSEPATGDGLAAAATDDAAPPEPAPADAAPPEPATAEPATAEPATAKPATAPAIPGSVQAEAIEPAAEGVEAEAAPVEADAERVEAAPAPLEAEALGVDAAPEPAPPSRGVGDLGDDLTEAELAEIERALSAQPEPTAPRLERETDAEPEVEADAPAPVTMPAPEDLAPAMAEAGPEPMEAAPVTAEVGPNVAPVVAEPAAEEEAIPGPDLAVAAAERGGETLPVAPEAAPVAPEVPFAEPPTVDRAEEAQRQTRSLFRRFRPTKPAGEAAHPVPAAAEPAIPEAVAASPAPVTEPPLPTAAPATAAEPVAASAAARPEPEPALPDSEPALPGPEPALQVPEAAAAIAPEPTVAAIPQQPLPVQPEVVPAPPDVVPAPPDAPAPQAATPESAQPADVVEQPTWRMVAPDAAQPGASAPGAPSAPAAPPVAWPAPPPPGLGDVPPAAAAWAARLATSRPETAAVWAASSEQVLGSPAQAPGPAPAVQTCVSCGLSLSANARFCRRCGTRQG